MRPCFRALLCAVVLAVAGCQTPKAPKTSEAKTASLSDETRPLWSRPGPGYLRTWLVCGEFPNPPHEGDQQYDHSPPCVGFETDYLSALGGEAAAQPKAGQTVKRPDGTAAAWTEHTSPKDVIDLTKLFPGRPTDNVVAYAYTTVERPAAGKAILAAGSDDGIRIWVNGKLVHDHLVARGTRPDEDIVDVELRKGVNHLLVKVEQGGGGWGFVLRALSRGEAAALDSGEIRPRIEPPPKGRPDALIIRSDTGVGTVVADPRPVTIEVVLPGGLVKGRASLRRGGLAQVSTSDWPNGPYEIRVSKDTPEGRRIYRHLPWYKGDWLPQARRLLDAADGVSATAAKPFDLRLRVLGQLVLDRLNGDPRKPKSDDNPVAVGPDDWQKIHSPLMEFRELALGTEAAIRPHGFIRLAWIDPIDDSPQFARAYLPPDYDPAETWPMAVVLHGYNPSNPPYVRWWSVANRHSGIAERNGVIVLEPHGRGNTSYRDIGDTDVLRAMAEAAKVFSIDGDRIYLTGYSMGGGGTWHVGTAHPELFAAIGPVYGGWDYHVWHDEDALADLAKRSARDRFLEERSSSFARAESLLNTPVFVNHGDADSLVEVGHSRYALKLLQRWGYTVRYWEHPGKGHGRLGHEGELVRWFLTHKRDRMPRQVRVRAARLRYAQAHWVRVERRKDPFAFIQVDARVTDRDTIRLDTANVLQVRLSPRAPLVDLTRPVRVIWNGESTGLHRLEKGTIVLWAPGVMNSPLAKTPQLEGPVDDVTNTPFAIVVGTIAKDPRMRRFVQLRAEARRDGWHAWQHAAPRYFTDTEITDDQLRRYSLLLYGGPDANAVTRKLIGRLPLKIASDAVTIGGQTFPATDAAVRFLYPNPLNPRRYVVIDAATSPDGMFQASHLPGHVDFAVTDARISTDDDVPGEKLHIVTGTLNHKWEYEEAYVLRGDAALRAKAPRRKAPRHLTAKVDAKRLPLSEVLETKSAGSFGVMMRDLNWRGKPLRLGRKTYASGIGVSVWHEPCTASYGIADAGWARLRATLGIEIEDPAKLEPKQKDGTRVFFVVRGDGKPLYRSPTFRWDSKPVALDLDIAGVKTLELEVGNEVTWHSAASSVNWADLRLEK